MTSVLRHLRQPFFLFRFRSRPEDKLPYRHPSKDRLMTPEDKVRPPPGPWMYRNEKQKELILKLMKGGHLRGSEIIPYDPAYGLPQQLPGRSIGRGIGSFNVVKGIGGFAGIPHDPAHGLPEQLPASSLVHVDNMMMGHVF